MKSITLSLLLAVLICGCSTSGENPAQDGLTPIDHTYAEYAELLANFVIGGQVDYAGLQANRRQLDSLLKNIATADIDSATADQKLAFYINAYNLITLRSIVDAYPVKSIKDIDGVWDKQKWPVAGEAVTLNQIEHDILRQQFAEPRIHMAVNCASIGCPPLASTPYRADSINLQLDRASRRFCADSSYNWIDTASGRAHLSSIFDWYGDDFVKPDADLAPRRNLDDKQIATLHFVLRHQPSAVQQAVKNRVITVEYLDYDWRLNDSRGDAAP